MITVFAPPGMHFYINLHETNAYQVQKYMTFVIYLGLVTTYISTIILGMNQIPDGPETGYANSTHAYFSLFCAWNGTL